MLNSQVLQAVGYDILKTTGTIMALNMAGVPDMVRNRLSGNVVLEHGADGVIYGTSRDIVNGLTNQNSNLMNGRYFEYIDDVGYFSVVSGLAVGTGAAEQLQSNVSKLSPLSQDMNAALIEGALVSLGSIAGSYIDNVFPPTHLAAKIRHPTRFFTMN